MATRLVSEHGGKLLHVHNVGWHFWTGSRWEPDERRNAPRLVRRTLVTACQVAVTGKDRQLMADVHRCNSAAGIRGTLDIASYDESIAATVADLDADPYSLNCANGTLDLRTLLLRDHDPGDRITHLCRGGYDPDAGAPLWDAFLARVLPDGEVREFVRRYAGVALLGAVREHKLVILKGIGRNGKTVFYNALAYALGSYATVAESELFLLREHGSAHPTGMMDLRGARWVVVSESDQGRRLAEATVKRLTGGDPITARHLYKDHVTFEPSHTPVLVTNHLPKVSADDHALWSRLLVVDFSVVIPDAEQDPALSERLRREADGILSWAVRGWQDYQRIGLSPPAAVLATTDQYRTDSDAVARFIDEVCVVGPLQRVHAAELFDVWTSWCAEDGGPPGSKRAFGLALDSRGFESAKGTGGVRWRMGIGLPVQLD
ncbi:hypothetical protein GV794_23500 [Nocardia cyriacigeorgica]|uniref:SF3 helicase domain-containing protein n=2 Tax=Nocardia cyriacigeorgica TaxID=135487 RepID=A0ABX0CQ06_9NOCA|nr:hypothetical protein [Nocardia cyriacigeorgica]